MKTAIKITIYINEADQYERRALYLGILDLLEAHDLSGVTLLRGVGGFTRPNSIGSTSFSEAGGTLPLILEFVDTPMNVDKILPALKEMVGQRLITREAVEVVNYHS